MNSVILIFIAFIVMSHQGVIPRNKEPDVSREVVIKTIAEDSPAVFEYKICPDGLQMDIAGVCREVWFSDWDED